MDHAHHTHLLATELTADTLHGASVYGPDDQRIGAIGDLVLSADGKVRSAIVDVGGFLGIGAKPVAIPFDELHFLRGENGAVQASIRWTKDQMQDLPEFVREEDYYIPYIPPMM